MCWKYLNLVCFAFQLLNLSAFTKQYCFPHNLCYEDTEIHCEDTEIHCEDTEIHCVEIAVLRKLKDFELICNCLSFVYATITILGIFLALLMTLLDRTWPGKSNEIGFRAIGRTRYTL
jgi:hypothetical protein